MNMDRTILTKEYPYLLDSPIHAAIKTLNGRNIESPEELQDIVISLDMRVQDIRNFKSEITKKINAMNDLTPFGEDYNKWKTKPFDLPQQIKSNLPRMKDELIGLMKKYNENMNAIIETSEQYSKNCESIVRKARNFLANGKPQGLLKNNEEISILHQNLVKLDELFHLLDEILSEMLIKRTAFAEFLIGKRNDLSDMLEKEKMFSSIRRLFSQIIGLKK